MRLLLYFLLVVATVVVALILVRLWNKRGASQYAAAAFLLLAVISASTPIFFRSKRPPELPGFDTTSIQASFDRISIEGPHRQLVFHYTLQNTTSHPFRIEAPACSMVSFRYSNQPRFDPASAMLEKDSAAYAKYTGLERLPTRISSLSLDKCPIELKPRQTKKVAIAIPYAYPATGKRPSQDDLSSYVRSRMRQIDGFGSADLANHYVIEYPKGW